MVDLTDRLALRKPAGSDPFLRADFLYNYDRLDDYPGYFPCTAGTHPTWGADQAGLMILETDTGKILRWTGSAFVTPNVFTKGVAFRVAAGGITVAANTAFTQAMGNFNPGRVCNVMIFATCDVGRNTNAALAAAMDQSIFVDGVVLSSQGHGYSFWPAGAGSITDVRSVPMIGYLASVSAASHSLSIRSACGIGGDSVNLGVHFANVIYLD